MSSSDQEAAALFAEWLYQLELSAELARQHFAAGDCVAAAYCLRRCAAHLVAAGGVLKSIHDKRASAQAVP